MNALERMKMRPDLPLLAQVIFNQHEKEQAALFMCGGLLGDCYIVQEIIDSFLTDVEAAFRKENWYRLTIKKNFRLCIDKLRECMSIARYNSASGSDLMRSIADVYSERIQSQIKLMYLGAGSELGRYKELKQPNIVAMWMSVDALFDYLVRRYDAIIEHMMSVYPAYYDSHYNHASGRDAYRYFTMALDEYDRKYVPVVVDANKVDSISRGMIGIVNTIALLEKDDSIKQNAMAETGQDAGDVIWDKSVSVLQSEMA